MGHAELMSKILSFVYLSVGEIEIIKAYFYYQKFQPKEFILNEGKVSGHLHFIITGLVRIFHFRDGKEITTYLADDHGFVSSYSSFINQTKSVENIQCLEQTEVLSISYKDMQELYKSIPGWERVGRILAEQNVLCLAERLLKLQSVPAKDKYQQFLDTSSYKIVQRTPMIHIASFLGIAPESLSRIRKSIS